MKALLQRVSEARVEAEGEILGAVTRTSHKERQP